MSNKRKKQRKKSLAAQLAKLNVQPAAKKPTEPKTRHIKCFEINFSLIDSNKNVRVVGQYFHQPRGTFQGIIDSFAYIHKITEEENRSNISAIERISIFEWALAIPGPIGIINTKRFSEPIYSWTYADKIKLMVNSLTKKQKKRIELATIQLDRWRPTKTKISIEEITKDVDNAVGVLLSL